MTWVDRVMKLAKEKRERWYKTTRRIRGGHITKSKYKGGFTYISGRQGFGPEGRIGKKK